MPVFPGFPMPNFANLGSLFGQPPAGNTGNSGNAGNAGNSGNTGNAGNPNQNINQGIGSFFANMQNMPNMPMPNIEIRLSNN